MSVYLGKSQPPRSMCDATVVADSDRWGFSWYSGFPHTKDHTNGVYIYAEIYVTSPVHLHMYHGWNTRCSDKPNTLTKCCSEFNIELRKCTKVSAKCYSSYIPRHKLVHTNCFRNIVYMCTCSTIYSAF